MFACLVSTCITITHRRFSFFSLVCCILAEQPRDNNPMQAVTAMQAVAPRDDSVGNEQTAAAYLFHFILFSNKKLE